ncbi:hypothetical protein niasHS_006606 [Heterodera schachtii]|uniref:Protein kinase domain-containing protein n=1 Tax=Heterodera schachtii TaxID=97005 RepID=A0ABD2JHR1_HETSC
MGNKGSTEQRNRQCPSETELSDFRLTGQIGVCSFGKVYSVLHKGMRLEYALKAMCKRRLIRGHQADSVLLGLEQLQSLTHPFIANLWFSFQDVNYVYIITDLLSGGDLAFHLKWHGRFSESRAKLLICEISLALEYLHRQRIGHFDVKPANIILDEEGHAHLSDFGLSKRLPQGQLVHSFSGTRPYMAPEILLTALGRKDGYSFEVDWWALGTCFYEMLRGRIPHEYPSAFSSLQVLNIVFTRPVVMPARWPSDLISFLRSMINPDPSRRITSFAALRAHPYMSRIEWTAVFERKMVPIFAPSRDHQHFHRGERGFRATVSAPIRTKGGDARRHFLHHPQIKERNSSDTGSGTKGEIGKYEEQMERLSAKFKQFNRFRCEVQPADARPLLDETRRSGGERETMERGNSKSKVAMSATAETPRGGKELRAKTQADRMRAMYRANNREVNYSM